MLQESIKRPKAALASSSVCERECLYGHLESEQRKDGGMRGIACGVGSGGGSVPVVCAHPDPYRVVLKNTGASVRNTGTRGDIY